jgi:glycosyltransferase involved in cell wall biosynthesis
MPMDTPSRQLPTTAEPMVSPVHRSPFEGDELLELSIVMPCLNEERTVGACIERALAAMRKASIQGEVIVADNGSTDDSVEIAAESGARVVHVSRRGYGAAVQGGCEAAKGRFILMGDPDASYDFADLDRFVVELRAGYDLVMGSRFRGHIAPGAMPWKNRYIGNPALTRILNHLYGVSMSDAHCGLRAFSRLAYERMALSTSGMEFASEMLIKASKANLKVTEIPISFFRDGRDRPPHLRPWHDGWRHMKLLLVYSPTALFLVPGLILLGAGFALMLLQLFAPVDQPLRLLGIRMDFHWAILGSLLALVGYQILTTHFFARIYSVTHRLHEEDRVLTVGFRLLTLERVLLLSVAAILGGTVLDGVVVWRWLVSDLGPLVSGYTRMFVFGSTLLALGIETFFNAFFFSILGDNYRQGHPGASED